MRKRIKDICEINKAVLSEQTSPDYCFCYIDISSVDSDGNINAGEPIYFGGAPSRARRLVSYKDTIISTVRTYLKAIAFIDVNLSKDVIASTGFAVLTPHKNLSPKFLYYAVRDDHVIDEITKRSLGVSYPAITSSELSSISVDIPPLPVQQRIVSFLDDKTAKIDKAVSLLQKKRDAYTRLKSSIINRSVTRGLNTNVKLKDSGVEWIGMIPENWEISLLKHACKRITDGSHFSPEAIYGDGKPYITVSNVRNNIIDIDGASRISNEDFELLVKTGCQPKVGDVLLSKDGTVGRTAIVTNNNFVVLSSLGIISPSNNLTSKFLKYMLDSRLLQNQMEIMMAGAALKRITIFKIEKLLCVVPSIEEQKAIASYLDTHCSRIDHAISIVDKQIDAYTRLKKSLINEVVTGKRKC